MKNCKFIREAQQWEGLAGYWEHQAAVSQELVAGLEKELAEKDLAFLRIYGERGAAKAELALVRAGSTCPDVASLEKDLAYETKRVADLEAAIKRQATTSIHTRRTWCRSTRRWRPAAESSKQPKGSCRTPKTVDDLAQTLYQANEELARVRAANEALVQTLNQRTVEWQGERKRRIMLETRIAEFAKSV